MSLEMALKHISGGETFISRGKTFQIGCELAKGSFYQIQYKNRGQSRNWLVEKLLIVAGKKIQSCYCSTV